MSAISHNLKVALSEISEWLLEISHTYSRSKQRRFVLAERHVSTHLRLIEHVIVVPITSIIYLIYVILPFHGVCLSADALLPGEMI